MTQAAPLQTSNAKPKPSDSTGLLLQRKCACGSKASALTGECEACGTKRMQGLQTKLAISEPGDRYEQEADRVADQVLTASASSSALHARPHIQRLPVQQPAEQSDAAPASVDIALARPGSPLEPALRQDMEWRFGRDFSKVRVHFGGAAEQSAREVNANAYTVGQHIVLGVGRFAPGSSEGQRLIAHELTHVVQQTQGEVADTDLRMPGYLDQATKPAYAHADSGMRRIVARDKKKGTFGNIPRDIPDPIEARRRVKLVKENGVWYEVYGGRQQHRANRSYDFVVQGGEIWAVHSGGRMGIQRGHTEAALGGRVEYAGVMRFGRGQSTRGTLLEWSNATGHYLPASEFSHFVPLDRDDMTKFKAVKDGQKKGPRLQLPVIQPESPSPAAPKPAPSSTNKAPPEVTREAGASAPPEVTNKPSASVKTPDQSQRGLKPQRDGSFTSGSELARYLTKVDKKLRKIETVARTVNRVFSIFGGVATILGALNEISSAESELRGEGFVLTDAIKAANKIETSAEGINEEYDGYSEQLIEMQESLFQALSDPISAGEAWIALKSTRQTLVPQRLKLNLLLGYVEHWLKMAKAGQRYANAILESSEAQSGLAFSEYLGNPIDAPTAFKLYSDLPKVIGPLQGALKRLKATKQLMAEDIEWFEEMEDRLFDVCEQGGACSRSSVIDLPFLRSTVTPSKQGDSE